MKKKLITPVNEKRSPQLEYYYRNKSDIIEMRRQLRAAKKQKKEYELYLQLKEKYGSE